MRALSCALAAIAHVALASAGFAQSGKSMRDQIVGTWSFVIAEVTTSDGKKSLPFGDKPKGMLIFTPDGHFSQIHVASGLPKVASNNRLDGSAEDNKAIVQGSLALFGTYHIDEDKKAITYRIEASTFPNWEGVEQTRVIESLTDDEFRNTNPAASRGGTAASAINIYQRVKQ